MIDSQQLTKLIDAARSRIRTQKCVRSRGDNSTAGLIEQIKAAADTLQAVCDCIKYIDDASKKGDQK